MTRTTHEGTWLGLWVAAVAAALVSGCGAISNLDRFRVSEDAGPGAADSGATNEDAGGDAGTSPAKDGGADAAQDGGVSIGCDNPATLCVRLRNFDRYDSHVLVLDLISELGELRSRVILDPVQKIAVQDVVLPLAFPSDEVPDMQIDNPLHVEIRVDKNDDGTYTPQDDDGFVVPLSQASHAEVDADVVAVKALTYPTPIGGDFTLSLSGFNIHTDRMLEVMLIEHATGRTVGMYRKQHIPMVDAATGSFSIVLPDVIAAQNLAYDIELYADADGTVGNHTYDGLFDDHSWILTERKATGGSLSIDRKHSEPKGVADAAFAELHYQLPFQN